MATEAITSYSSYDSNRFPTLTQSLEHALNNPLSIEKLSDKIMMDFEGLPVLVQEPTCPFKDFIKFYYEKDFEEIDLPEKEWYRPEMTAKRLYDNSDMWYVLLLINNCYSTTKWKSKKIKYVRSDKLESIAKFIQLAEDRVIPFVNKDITDLDF